MVCFANGCRTTKLIVTTKLFEYIAKMCSFASLKNKNMNESQTYDRKSLRAVTGKTADFDEIATKALYQKWVNVYLMSLWMNFRSMCERWQLKGLWFMRVAGSSGVIVCLNLFLLTSGRKSLFFMCQ